MIDHAPARLHLGGCHDGAVLPRCHTVVSRTGGGNTGDGEVDLLLRVDVVPLGDLDVVHKPHKKEH